MGETKGELFSKSSPLTSQKLLNKWIVNTLFSLFPLIDRLLL